MIAADTGARIDFSKGVESAASAHLEAEQALVKLPRLGVLPGYWERAGELRRTLLKRRLKARSMDCLIAQSCLDHDVGLIAADQDYRHFVKLGLKLA